MAPAQRTIFAPPVTAVLSFPTFDAAAAAIGMVVDADALPTRADRARIEPAWALSDASALGAHRAPAVD
jgi:hypothetical protein